MRRLPRCGPTAGRGLRLHARASGLDFPGLRLKCGAPPWGGAVAEVGPPAAGRAWCFPPRKPLFFRRRAPRLGGRMGIRPVGRGAPLPASPCSFVDRHHVFRAGWTCGRAGVVLPSPLALVLSSSSTTSLAPDGLPAGRTWCSAPRKPLFLRRQAPRLWGRTSRPPVRRGASLPASPCSFVDRHHVFGAGRADRRLDVVLHFPLALVLSSTGTTSLGPDGPAAGWTWCSAPRKPLFLRRQAPRLWGRTGRPPGGRGASLPASPCSFVDRHHVFGAGRADRRLDVVLHFPLALVLSSTGTTSLGPDGSPAALASKK